MNSTVTYVVERFEQAGLTQTTPEQSSWISQVRASLGQ
jgi:hypothetical protein